MKKVLQLFVISCCLFLASNVFADSYTVYNPDYAVAYATKNYNTPYGSKSTQNPFGDYSYLVNGGNCTNFVSQAIIAGMINSDKMATVFSQRANFDIDASKGTSYQWYYINDSKRGYAFTGAPKLFEYACYNISANRGLHFMYIMRDTSTKPLDYWNILAGDVIFADWNQDGTIDHTLLVTEMKLWNPMYQGYNKIRVTYQGCKDAVGKTDQGLRDINVANKKLYNCEAAFYVFCPVDYNPNGK